MQEFIGKMYMSFSINGFKSNSTFDIASDLKKSDSESTSKPFSGKLSVSQKASLDQLSEIKPDPTKATLDPAQDAASASIKNALEQVEGARSAVAALRDEQASIIETTSNGVAAGADGVNALNKLNEIDTEISRIKNQTYSSGINPFSTSTQILGDKSQTTSGVVLSGSSSTYSLSTYTSGIPSLSAATATTALTAADSEVFVAYHDANSASASADASKNLGVVDSPQASDSSTSASSLSFEQAQALAVKISSDLISKFGGAASSDVANSKLLEQTISSVANIDVGRAAELLS